MNIPLTARVRILKFFLILTGILLFFWWPVSHWFYSDAYHFLLGFEPGTFPGGMVKIIGTCGVFPVLLAIFSSKDPVHSKYMILTMIASLILLGLTFLHLIHSGEFPNREYVNAGLCLAGAGFLIFIFPWQASGR